MWPAATSTTMPSGSLRPSLTMVFKSEPSGFDVRMRPAARSKKYKRPTVFAATTFTVSDFEALEDGIGISFSFLCCFHLSSVVSAEVLSAGLDEGAETRNGLADNQV